MKTRIIRTSHYVAPYLSIIGIFLLCMLAIGSLGCSSGVTEPRNPGQYQGSEKADAEDREDSEPEKKSEKSKAPPDALDRLRTWYCQP